jgi:hypothetical protein
MSIERKRFMTPVELQSWKSGAGVKECVGGWLRMISFPFISLESASSPQSEKAIQDALFNLSDAASWDFKQAVLTVVLDGGIKEAEVRFVR